MSTSKRDLIEAIVELRADVERQLKLNKYYIAMAKLDELLAALKPLESIELGAARTDGTSSARRAPRQSSRRRPSWSGVVQETVDELRRIELVAVLGLTCAARHASSCPIVWACTRSRP
jgi:hypothetical protein